MRSSLRLGKQERVRKGAVFWFHNLKQKSQIQKNSNEKRNPLFFALKWKKKCRFLRTKKIINGYFYVKSWKLPLFSVFTVLFSSCSKHTFFWYKVTAICNCKAGILILWANVSLGWKCLTTAIRHDFILNNFTVKQEEESGLVHITQEFGSSSDTQ